MTAQEHREAAERLLVDAERKIRVAASDGSPTMRAAELLLEAARQHAALVQVAAALGDIGPIAAPRNSFAPPVQAGAQ